jgi:hypothetical protein
MEGNPPSGLRQAAWPSFLRGEDDHQIIERLSFGDPLRLREGAARRLRELFFLIEPDRAFHRAVAACAHGARREQPPEDLARWALGKIDLAIEQLVNADREAESTHPELLSDEDKNFPLLTTSMMLDPELVRKATVAFNVLDDPPRRAFFQLLIEGRNPGEVIEAGPLDEDALYAAIQTALAPFGLNMESAPAEDRKKKGRKQ